MPVIRVTVIRVTNTKTLSTRFAGAVIDKVCPFYGGNLSLL
jgi:hypothetical protein